jgi:hypothetical protein
MQRRQFVTLVVGTLIAWPLAARAQQPLPTIGFMGANATVFASWTAAFVARLRELGWIEGHTVHIEYRWSEGRPERNAEIAAEFARLKVNVIVTLGSAVPALKQVTSVIPIVFALSTDPVGGRLVASLARPGGNVTGISNQAADVASKRLEFLRAVVPDLRRLAVMLNVGFPQAVLEMGGVQVAAHKLDLEVTPLEIRRAEDIPLRLRHSTPKRMHFTSWMMLSLLLTAHASSHLRSKHGYRRSSITPVSSKPGVSYLMDQTSPTCTGSPPTWSTKFCAGPNRPKSRSSSPPNLILSSTSGPLRRSVSLFRITYSCSPTR